MHHRPSNRGVFSTSVGVYVVLRTDAEYSIRKAFPARKPYEEKPQRTFSCS